MDGEGLGIVGLGIVGLGTVGLGTADSYKLVDMVAYGVAAGGYKDSKYLNSSFE